MCIAIVKKRGVLMPNEETLNICFENNPHGCGYTLCRNGKNFVYKGFMTLSELMDSFKQTNPLQSESVMIHFRVASVGSINKSNCHPFVVSKNYDTMKKLNTKTNLPVLVHNGTFKFFNEHKDDYSDTMQFTKMVATILQDQEYYFYKPINNFINHYIKNNNCRVAVMYKSGFIDMFGNWIKDEKTNLYFSNENYRYITDRFAVKQLEFDF